jgi:hypothetical protein
MRLNNSPQKALASINAGGNAPVTRPPDNRTAYRANPLAAMRIGILNGTVPSAVSNTGATSSAFLASDPSLPTGHVSTVVFHLPNGIVAPATAIHQVHHDVRAPAGEVNIVPSLVGHSLLSTSKFVAAGYTAIYDKDKVNFYDMCTTTIMVLADAVLKGWQCPRMNLWHVPLVGGELIKKLKKYIPKNKI